MASRPQPIIIPSSGPLEMKRTNVSIPVGDILSLFDALVKKPKREEAGAEALRKLVSGDVSQFTPQESATALGTGAPPSNMIPQLQRQEQSKLFKDLLLSDVGESFKTNLGKGLAELMTTSKTVEPEDMPISAKMANEFGVPEGTTFSQVNKIQTLLGKKLFETSGGVALSAGVRDQIFAMGKNLENATAEDVDAALKADFDRKVAISARQGEEAAKIQLERDMIKPLDPRNLEGLVDINGNPVPIGTNMRELIDMNAFPLSVAEQKKIGALRDIEGILDRTDELINEITFFETPFERAYKSPGRFWDIKTQSDDALVALVSWTHGTLPKLIRAMGEVGNLNETEQLRGLEMMVSPYDTKKVMERKRSGLREYFKKINPLIIKKAINKLKADEESSSNQDPLGIR